MKSTSYGISMRWDEPLNHSCFRLDGSSKLESLLNADGKNAFEVASIRHVVSNEQRIGMGLNKYLKAFTLLHLFVSNTAPR